MAETKMKRGTKVPRFYDPAAFGEPGLPGFMPQPDNCHHDGINYVGRDWLYIDLAICRYSCKKQCEEWREYCKEIKKIQRKCGMLRKR